MSKIAGGHGDLAQPLSHAAADVPRNEEAYGIPSATLSCTDDHVASSSPMFHQMRHSLGNYGNEDIRTIGISVKL